MNTSDDVNELASAMAKAQAVITNPTKAKENSFFKTAGGKFSTYADMASGLKSIRPALSAQGLAFFQISCIGPDRVFLKTRIIHSSGQWIESEYPVAPFLDQQKLAAAMTYARRNALFALVGIAGEDDDDDGNGNFDANGSQSHEISTAQAAELRTMFANEPRLNKEKFLNAMAAVKIEAIPAHNFKEAIDLLENGLRTIRCKQAGEKQ